MSDNDKMEAALQELSEDLGVESWNHITSFIVKNEQKYPGFKERAQKLVDLYRELNPPRPSSPTTIGDALIALGFMGLFAWCAWLVYLFIMANRRVV